MQPILILEDDDNLRPLVLEALEDAGYQVIATHSPDQAIELSRQRAFALVLADVRMAGSTDGVGAVEKIKEIQPYIRSIIMTGYASLEVPLRAAKIKADDYLLKGDKNFGLDELLRVVRNTLELESEDSNALLRFLSLPGKLAKAPMQAWLEAKLPELQAERQSFFKSLYVLLRPGHLSKEDALGTWRRVENLESSFHSITVPNFVKLRGTYATLERVLGLELDTERAVGGELLETVDTPRDVFNTFYERVRSGKVSYEQFERAAWLRLHPASRKENAEAYTLYHWLWSPTDSSPPEPQPKAPEPGRTLAQLFPLRQIPTSQQIWSAVAPLCDSVAAHHQEGRVLESFSLHSITLANGKIEFASKPVTHAEEFEAASHNPPEAKHSIAGNVYSLGSVIASLSMARLHFATAPLRLLDFRLHGKPLFDAPTPFQKKLTRVLTKMLQEDPSHRYPSVGEARQALAAVFDAEHRHLDESGPDKTDRQGNSLDASALFS